MGAPVSDSYAAIVGSTINAGIETFPSWLPPVGSAQSISLNTLQAINPANDPLANPNYPLTPPWERSGAWIHALDYGGAVMADDVGPLGTIMFYGAAGHSACNPTMWCGFDLATRMWKRIGRRSLPNDDMYLGLDGYPGVLDNVWGDYDGSASVWGAFAQPGYNPPAGSHHYAGLAYRPAAKAGNSSGEVFYPMNATGATAGTAARGSWVYSPDTTLFTRSANLRPASGGSTVGGTQYFEGLDAAFALNTVGTSWLMHLDCFDWTTGVWTRSNSLNQDFVADLSGISFKHEAANLYIVCTGIPGGFGFYAAQADRVKAGQSWSWVSLNVVLAPGSTFPAATAWMRHDDHDCWYAVDGTVGSNSIWRLEAPSGNQAAVMAGTWTVTKLTFAGESLYAKDANGTNSTVWNNRFLLYSRKTKCLFWITPYIGGVVQAIKPGI